ncbi:c-type cytochrome domain-containing protein [Granulicella arctica]|uniref:c-type cytochrome domain-containing protein n=1 Tax=Granulicella arctica TaxID=940613 RepID=UPI0021E077AF|nr:c-type cytochrome domain-containing protein [Granulicella arctica]
MIMATAGMISLGDPKTHQAQSEASNPEFYLQHVRPIFEAHCVRCHGNSKHRGGLSMESRQDLLMDRRNKPIVIPGDAANSLLVRLIRHEGPPNDPMPMPSKRERLSDTDILMIERWVQAGAIMPSTLSESKR